MFASQAAAAIRQRSHAPRRAASPRRPGGPDRKLAGTCRDLRCRNRRSGLVQSGGQTCGRTGGCPRQIPAVAAVEHSRDGPRRRDCAFGPRRPAGQDAGQRRADPFPQELRSIPWSSPCRSWCRCRRRLGNRRGFPCRRNGDERRSRFRRLGRRYGRQRNRCNGCHCGRRQDGLLYRQRLQRLGRRLEPPISVRRARLRNAVTIGYSARCSASTASQFKPQSFASAPS